MNVGKTYRWCPLGLRKTKTNEGIRPEKGVMLRSSLGLARTAYLPVMTTARIHIISHGLTVRWHYHMYDTDSFLGSLY